MEHNMTDRKREFTTIQQVQEFEAQKVSDGFAGRDKYTISQYSKAGVTWEHNIWNDDRYYVRGVKIDQQTAECITGLALVLGRSLTDDELWIKFSIKV